MHASRSYVHEYVSGPLALEFYRSRFSVSEHAGSAQEEAELAEAISGIYRPGLDELASRGRRPPDGCRAPARPPDGDQAQGSHRCHPSSATARVRPARFAAVGSSAPAPPAT